MVRKNGEIPLYIQVKRAILDKIETREWAPHAKIPGEFEMTQLFSVSRATVRRALDELERDGVISRRTGDGTYVTIPQIDQRLGSFYSFSNEVRALGMANSTEVLDFSVLHGDSLLLNHLHLEKDSLVYRIRRLRIADEIPFAVETSYLPCSCFPQLTRELVEELGLYEAMKKSTNIVPDTAQETFEAVLMRDDDAKLLGCVSPVAALRLERITMAKDIVVEYCLSVVRGDRYKYHVFLR